MAKQGFPVFDPDGGKPQRWKRLSLGAGVSVPTEDILGIFDMDTATVSPTTKKFLNTAQKRGGVSVVGEELPKSFVVIAPRAQLLPGGNGGGMHTQEVHRKNESNQQTETHVVLSQFAPSTLCGRDGSI